jgi:lipid A 3-O-deacylase
MDVFSDCDRNNMKTITKLAVFVFVAFLCASLMAQAPADKPLQALRVPGWSKGVFVGGSTSFANTPSAQTFLAGARFGRVLTHELGHKALRGSFEMAVDIIPINEFWVDGNAQYAGAIDPFIAKWNFTGGNTFAPYLAAVGGVVFSSSNLPPGDTSQVNFTSGAELGLQWFRRERRSIDFAVKIYHLSNASIGNRNPGINGAVQFMVGYTWR